MTFAEFMRAAHRHGCREKVTPGRHGPTGPPSRREIVRTVGGQTLVTQVPNGLDDDEVLFEGTLDYWLRELCLEPGDLR